MLVILTAVEKVCIIFNTPEQQELSSMTVAEAEKYIEEGQFARQHAAEGEACIEFVQQHPEGRALITSLECAADGLKGRTGTIITA